MIYINSYFLSSISYKRISIILCVYTNRYVPIRMISDTIPLVWIRIFRMISDTNLLVWIRINFSFYQPVYNNSYILYDTISFIRYCIFPNLGDNWENIKDEHGCRLIIGQFHFTKRENEGFTASNECWDVFAAMELSAKLLLEEYSVHDLHRKINDSLMKLIKNTSEPGPDHAPINNNSFGRVNKKFVRFFIDMLSLQLVFDNWYVTIRILVIHTISYNSNCFF